MAVDHNICIQMKQKKLTRAFVIISNWKNNNFGLHNLTKKYFSAVRVKTFPSSFTGNVFSSPFIAFPPAFTAPLSFERPYYPSMPLSRPVTPVHCLSIEGLPVVIPSPFNASSSDFTASLPPFSTTSPLICDSLLPFNASLSSFNACTSLFNAPVAPIWFCHACYASVSTLTPLHCNCRLCRRSLMPLGQSWIPLCRHLITPHYYLTHLRLLVSFCCLSIAMWRLHLPTDPSPSTINAFRRLLTHLS